METGEVVGQMYVEKYFPAAASTTLGDIDALAALKEQLEGKK